VQAGGRDGRGGPSGQAAAGTGQPSSQARWPVYILASSAAPRSPHAQLTPPLPARPCARRYAQTVTNVSPSVGSMAGGTDIEISGTGFAPPEQLPTSLATTTVRRGHAGSAAGTGGAAPALAALVWALRQPLVAAAWPGVGVNTSKGFGGCHAGWQRLGHTRGVLIGPDQRPTPHPTPDALRAGVGVPQRRPGRLCSVCRQVHHQQQDCWQPGALQRHQVLIQGEPPPLAPPPPPPPNPQPSPQAPSQGAPVRAPERARPRRPPRRLRPWSCA
jgi:hypothetical protein